MTEVNNQTESLNLYNATSAAPSANTDAPLSPPAILELVDSEDVRDLLLRISREMASANSLDQILQMMVNTALRIVPAAEKCVIHLLNDDGTRLQAKVCSQPSAIAGEISGIPANMGIAGRALSERNTYCVRDTWSDPGFAPLHSGPELRSLLVSPLFVREVALGTLSLSSSQAAAFDLVDQQHIQTLAAQASVAIHQAHLLREAVEARQLSDAIVESLTDGLLMLGPQGQVLRMNPVVYEMLEIPWDAFELPLDPAADPACPARLRWLLNPSGGRVIGPYELELALPSGSAINLRVIPAPLKELAAGEIRIIHNITAEREAGKSLALFTSHIAHELRAPLQHIVSFTDFINEFEDLPPDSYRHFTRHILGETNCLERLVDDLVQLSRIETGHFALHLEEVRVDELVADAVSKAALRTQLKGLALGFCDPHQAIWVMADPLRLGQVLANLLENALKYVPQGGRIDVSIKQMGKQVTVSVADTGPGIAPEILPYLFDQFYQVRRSDRQVGMGLGLYISREIVRAHGGAIWVESELNVGTAFSFQLPTIWRE